MAVTLESSHAFHHDLHPDCLPVGECIRFPITNCHFHSTIGPQHIHLESLILSGFNARKYWCTIFRTPSSDSFFQFITHIRCRIEKTSWCPALTESLSDQKIVISPDPSPSHEKIIGRKTIVYETLVDPTVIKLKGEKLKTVLFTKLFFFRPPPEEIQLVSINKYYEPFIVISGKYAIDYYRKSAFTIRLDKEAREVILLNQRFRPEQSKDPYGENHNVIKLEGEERIMKEFNDSLILDRSGKDIRPERLPSGPSERNPEKLLTESGVKEIAEDTDLNIIRSRILKRPKDINRIVNELIEVNERVVIYAPRFRLVYRDTITGSEKALEFDGVTAKRIYIHRNI